MASRRRARNRSNGTFFLLLSSFSICRSSTLSQKVEFLFQQCGNQIKAAYESAGLPVIDWLSEDSTSLMERIRTSDIYLNNILGVKFICDLMTENKKTK
jgi:hypothetical protein